VVTFSAGLSVANSSLAKLFLKLWPHFRETFGRVGTNKENNQITFFSGNLEKKH